MYGFAISKQGQQHKTVGLPCQDYSEIIRIETAEGGKLLAACVADGVGSAKRSEHGAAAAGAAFLNTVRKGVQEAECDVENLLRQAFCDALQAVFDLAAAENHSQNEYETTLTGCLLFDDGTLYYGHAGDGGLIGLFEDGTYKPLTRRCKGDTPNSTYPLSARQHWSFGRAGANVAGAFLCSDGILDHFCSCDEMNGGMVYFPFIAPAFGPLCSENEVALLKKAWEDLLEGKQPYGGKTLPQLIGDDLSVVVLGRNEVMEDTLKNVCWDEEKFNRDLLAARRNLFPDLYPEPDIASEVPPASHGAGGDRGKKLRMKKAKGKAKKLRVILET